MIIIINLILMFAIIFSYVNRALIINLGIENLPYFITLMMIGANVLFSIFGGLKKNLMIFCVFIYLGLSLLVINVLRMDYTIATIGFIALFINLILWVTIYNNIPLVKSEKFFGQYIKINIIFALINALVGIYQYFIDPSIFGLAIHDIYGNSAMLDSGQAVRRVTALMGSPQNYSLYIAIMTCLSYVYINKPITRNFIVFFLLIAGGLSGSRAYSIFIITAILFSWVVKYARGVNLKTFIKALLLMLTSLGVLLTISSGIFNNATIYRLINFKDLPVLRIFLDNLNSVTFHDLILGKGLGYNERIVSVYLDTPYISVESYLLSLFLQGGLLLFVSFMIIYLTAVMKCFKNRRDIEGSLLIALFINLLFTPSFNGLAMSFIIWPIIIYPIYSFIGKSSKIHPNNYSI